MTSTTGISAAARPRRCCTSRPARTRCNWSWATPTMCRSIRRWCPGRSPSTFGGTRNNLLRYSPHPCGSPCGPPAAFRSAIQPIQSASRDHGALSPWTALFARDGFSRAPEIKKPRGSLRTARKSKRCRKRSAREQRLVEGRDQALAARWRGGFIFGLRHGSGLDAPGSEAGIDVVHDLLVGHAGSRHDGVDGGGLLQHFLGDAEVLGV